MSDNPQETKKNRQSRVFKDWARRNPDKIKANMERYRASEKGKRTRYEHNRLWRERNKDKVKASSKKYADKIQKEKRSHHSKCREAILEHYGSFCRCCGEGERSFLCVDHINHGKGNPAPRVKDFYGWIIKNGFPDDLQILCHNCNTAKGLYGKCPHKKI